MISRFLIMAACVFAVLPDTSHSAGRRWYVTPDGSGDAATIQSAVDSAAAGDTVMLAAGTFTGAGNRDADFLGKAIVVTSESGASKTTVDCQGLGGAFVFQNGELPSSILSNITIINSSTTAVTITDSSPVIQGNYFVDCTSVIGGAVSIGGLQTPVLANNTFTNCDAWSGGAIGVLPGARAEVRDNHFTLCDATARGGGVFCGGGAEVILSGNRFESNSAAAIGPNGAGGGLYGDAGSILEITNNVFDANVALDGAYGAGIGLYFANGTVLSNRFTNNTVEVPASGSSGGGLFSWNSGDLLVEGNDFEDNSADGGGGMWLGVDTTYTLDTLYVRSNRFVGNHAGFGGGASVGGHRLRPAVVDHCTFTANSAINGGGGRFAADVFVRRSEFTGNHATGSGGGLYAQGMLSYCTVTGNTATAGGGLENSGTVTFCQIGGNTAQFGGGIHITDGNVRHCTIVANKADFGGGIAIDSLYYIATAAVENSIIAFNTGGGAFNCPADTTWDLSVSCSDIFGNAGGDSFCGITGWDNISEDPLFCDTQGGVYTLATGSPCAPANSICGVQMGAFGVDCGPVPVTFAAVHATAHDGAVEIRWDVIADEPVAGFDVYRSAASSGAERRINTAGPVDAGERTFRDESVRPSTRYTYRVVAVTPDGAELSSRTATVTTRPGRLALEQNTPNPFNPSTSIRYTLPAESPVEIAVYNARGSRVTTLVSEVQTAGPHDVTWNGRDHRGRPVGSGVYFVKLTAGKRTLSRKMLLLK